MRQHRVHRTQDEQAGMRESASLKANQSERERAKARELRKDGMPLRDIATRLGRSYSWAKINTEPAP